MGRKSVALCDVTRVTVATNQQPVFPEPLKAARRDPLGGANGVSHLPRLDPRVRCNVGEDSSVPTVVPLQQVFGEQAGSADTQTQGGAGHPKIAVHCSDQSI